MDSTAVLLIRHAHTDAIGRRLTGRAPGVPLSDTGRAQLPLLQHALASYAIAAVYTSPLERAVETARAVAEPRGLHARWHDGLTEVDFGEWTGKTFEELATIEGWHRFNTHRATAPVPSGETPGAVQTRIVAALRSLGRAHVGQTIAAVSHADVIRAAVLHYAGISLDDFERFEIGPASVTVLSLSPRGDTLEMVGRSVGQAACP